MTVAEGNANAKIELCFSSKGQEVKQSKDCRWKTASQPSNPRSVIHEKSDRNKERWEEILADINFLNYVGRLQWIEHL